MTPRPRSRLPRPVAPSVGDIYWMLDADFGIVTSAEEHPVLVTRAQAYVGGPVTVAPGSSHRPLEPGVPILVVEPGELAVPGGLDRETRFFLANARRHDVPLLGDYIGRLGERKQEELRRIRGLGI